MSSLVRVLHITSRADFGGGPEHVFQVVKHSPEQWENFIACPPDVPYMERYTSLVTAQRVCTIPHRRWSLRAFWKLRRFVREQGIDIIHSHGKGAGLYGRLLHLCTRKPCIHTFHGVHMDGYSPLVRQLYQWYESIMGKLTYRAIAVSPSEQAYITREKLFPKERIVCIPNGVVFPESSIEDTTEEPLRIVSITRFDAQKHTELIIPILYSLKEEQQVHRIQIVLIGDGPGKKALEAKLRAEHLLQYVVFVGNVLSVAPYLKNAFAYLSTSHWEGMPLGLLEAMSYGVPVVASDVIGNDDAVEHEGTGLLYPDDDAYGAAHSLLRLMASPKTAKAFGQASRERVRKLYSIQQMVASLMLLYDECMTHYHVSR